jgi:glucose-1-phosphate cytidylyltransferase
MKTVILCGGRGSRLSEQTVEIPKPLVTIDGKPILHHLMQIYSTQGHRDFILAGGYKFEMIKEYFCNYYMHNSDITVDTSSGEIEYLPPQSAIENFKIHMINTGLNTETGGRMLQVKDYIDEDIFMCNYSDGLAEIDINDLIKFHKSHRKIATVTVVKKQGKFGIVQMENDIITSFQEKPVDNSYINGGFFVFNREVFDYMQEGDLPDTLELLAKDEEFMAYKKCEKWECMDTVRDRTFLENLCKEDNAFWRK